MSDIYVVVIETGEYSQWDKKLVCYFTNEKDAEVYAEVRKAMCDKKKRMEEGFECRVEKVEHGTQYEDAESILDAAQKRKEEEDRHNRQKEVNGFLDWWSNGPKNDPHFNDKVNSKCRSIKSVLYQYAEETKDSRALTWLACNSQFFH